jgi:anti-anti-sigma regulatory factor
MSAPSVIKVGRTHTGYRLRIEGKGTMRESPAVEEFARYAFQQEPCALVVDLSTCEYLDSTFLGCLVILHKKHGRGQSPQLSITASPQVRQRVLAPNHLEALFCIVGECPAVIGEELVLTSVALGPGDLARHILECHRQLAEIEGPNRRAFEQVADELARELAGIGSSSH